MALDPTARESNVKDSIKKFFIETFETGYSIPLLFDVGLATPNLQNMTVRRWMTISVGISALDNMSEAELRLFLCTRTDPEGFVLAQLRDTVMGELTNTTETDGLKRISLYRSKEVGAWDLIGSLLVMQPIFESPRSIVAPDETKYKTLTCRLRWGTKI